MYMVRTPQSLETASVTSADFYGRGVIHRRWICCEAYLALFFSHHTSDDFDYVDSFCEPQMGQTVL